MNKYRLTPSRSLVAASTEFFFSSLNIVGSIFKNPWLQLETVTPKFSELLCKGIAYPKSTIRMIGKSPRGPLGEKELQHKCHLGEYTETRAELYKL